MSEKLDALRALLKQNELAGFIIPHNDEYREEITPPCFERLKWLTGFSGSAGVALVLKHKAFLLVDGRYTVQVRKEVDEKDFQILDISTNPLIKVIEKEAKLSERIGYDPRLHTLKEISALKKNCDKTGCYLVAFRRNLIDMIWKDRPALPATEVEALPDEYSGLSLHRKIEQVAADLMAQKQDAIVIDAPSSICWLLNVRGNDVPYNPVVLSQLIVHKNASVDWFIDSERISDKVRKHLGEKIRILPPAIFEAELGRLAKKRASVRIDALRTSAWLESTLAKSGGNIVLGDDPCVNLKAVKNETEQEGVRQAHIRDGAAISSFLAWLYNEGLDLGVNEYRAAQKLAEIRAALSPLYKGDSFATISAFGANAAIVHYVPSEKLSRKITDKGIYLLDAGAHYVDGTTDITRTVSFGKVSPFIKRRFTQVLKGAIALATAIFPEGTYGFQLDAMARQFLWRDGVDYAHGTGHGVGSYLEVHEAPPSIGYCKDSLPLCKGMLLTNEPGYYKENDFGIRIENMMLVVPYSGRPDAEEKMLSFQILTKVPLDTNMIEKEMLSEVEIAWVNMYHKQVFKALKPFVDSPTLNWLKQVTAEI